MKVHAVEEKKQKGASRPEWVSELLLKKETLKHPCGGNAGQEDQTVSCSSLPYLQGCRNRGGGQGRGVQGWFPPPKFQSGRQIEIMPTKVHSKRQI